MRMGHMPGASGIGGAGEAGGALGAGEAGRAGGSSGAGRLRRTEPGSRLVNKMCHLY